jgi:hypothetical protein
MSSILGFSITIGGTIIQMTRLDWPWNLFIYAVFIAFSFWLFLFYDRFQNKLIALKNRYEAKAR